METAADLFNTYQNICEAKGKQPNQFLVRVFDFLSNDADRLIRNSDYLKLCGDNWLASDGSVRIDDDALECLVDALLQQKKYTAIDMRYNRITDAGAVEIARLLEQSPDLTELNLMCNELSDKGAGVIAAALRSNSTLKTLRMNGNKMGDAGGMHFAQMLQTNETLESLDLGDCDLGIEAFIALITVMRYNTAVTCLNLNRPLLWTKQEEHIYHTAQMLKVNKTLRELHLQKCEITDWGAQRLAETLVANRTLCILDLSANRITRDGAKALALVIKADTRLLVLDLANNRIEDDGAIYLSRALGAHNRTLRVLNVQRNNIAAEGLCTLAETLKVNHTLDQLYVWGNKLNKAACTALAKVIEQGRLQQKYTDVKPYVVDSVTYLAELPYNIDYRKYYYWAPVYGSEVPTKESDIIV